MSTASRLISYEDSFLLPEDKYAEIVKGELRRMPPPRLRYALLFEELALLLRCALDARFRVLVSAFGQLIRKVPFTYRIPDLGVYVRERLADEHYISAVPERLVEVISPANRKGNLTELIGDYDELGAPELWLIEADRQRIVRMVRENERLVESGIFSDGSISPRRVPEASIPLANLWNL